MWTRRDADLFAALRGACPAARAAVCIAEVNVNQQGELGWHRALDPAAVGVGAVTAVIRIADSFHQLFERRRPVKLATLLERTLAPLMAELTRTPDLVRSIQLDHDVGIAHLGAYAEVVQRLAEGIFRGMPLWITSLPSHLDDPDYAARFRAACAGQVLQLFDTDILPSPVTIRRLEEQLTRQVLPIELGVGTFERRRWGGTTEHTVWLSVVPQWMVNHPQISGLWLFPAGKPYRFRDGPLGQILQLAALGPGARGT